MKPNNKHSILNGLKAGQAGIKVPIIVMKRKPLRIAHLQIKLLIPT